VRRDTMNVMKLLLAAKALGDGLAWTGTFDGKPVDVSRVRLRLGGEIGDGRVQVGVVFRGVEEHRAEAVYEIRGGKPDVVRYNGRETENAEADFDAGVRGLGAALRYTFRFTVAGVAHVLAVSTRLGLDALLWR